MRADQGSNGSVAAQKKPGSEDPGWHLCGWNGRLTRRRAADGDHGHHHHGNPLSAELR